MNSRISLPSDTLRELCERYQIRRLAIFGSALGKEFSPESDVDILVDFEPSARIGLRFFRLEKELSELLGREVDLNTAGFLSPYFRERVVAEAETICAAP